MLKKYCLFIVLLFAALGSQAQQLYMQRNLGGARYFTDSLNVSSRQVLDLMRENTAAYNEFREANRKSGFASVLGVAGSILIAVPVVTTAIGGKPEWIMAAAGGALVFCSIPLTRSSNRHAANALETYNMKYQTSRLQPRLYLGATGARLLIRF